MLNAVKGWLRSLGLVSYDKVALRGNGERAPQIATLLWDLSAPSYLAPLVDHQGPKTSKVGFIACDVLLCHEVSVQGLRPFLHKCRTLRGLKKVGKCLQFFVADAYTSDAFRLAKENGIIPATPKSLFGEEVAAALGKLFDVLRTAAEHADPEVFLELFERLGKIEGASINLRGALFEFIVADTVRKGATGDPMICRNWEFKIGERKAEVDVVAVARKSYARFIECKGHQPNGLVDDDEVKRWLERRIPTVRSAIRKMSEFNNTELSFEFWTTGNLTPEAHELINNFQANTRKLRIVVMEADAVLAAARETHDASLVKVLSEHFLHHPLATAKSAAKRKRRHRKSEMPPMPEAELVSFPGDAVSESATRKRGNPPF